MIPPPTTHDGRNLDTRIADERGEGAAIAVERPDVAWPVAKQPEPATDTYYDLPIVKHAPWSWAVPAYFYAGGLAGAASTLGLHPIAIAAEAVGGTLLIADLGKPLRFLNMMRVFRPTSPMNMGTWILSATAGSTALSLVVESKPLRVVNALAGSMLSTYTGVLVGNTSIPLWKATRNWMPLYFAASSAASLASVLELLGKPRRGYAIAAKAAKLAGALGVEARAEASGVAQPLRDNRKWRAAKWLGVASLAATLLRRDRLAGVLGTASALLGRFAVVEAGRASAADPRATVELQREAIR